MRKLSPLLGLAVLCSVGCNGWNKTGTVQPPPPPPAAPGRPPTADELREFISRNGRHIDTLKVEELDMEVKAQGHNPSLRGSLYCQKPRNFRLTAKVLGSPEVDLGSNSDEFWFWIKRAEPPYLYHCNYNDFNDPAKRVGLPFPFQAEWVLEVLGMSDRGARDSDPNGASNFSVEHDPKTKSYLLYERTVSRGQPVTKITAFQSEPMVPPKPQIWAHVLLDSKQKVLFRATVQEVARVDVDRAAGQFVTYPKRVRLEWPEEKTELRLRLDTVTVNPQLPAQQVNVLFSRPTWSHVQPYDLAGNVPQGRATSIQRVGAVERRRGR